MLPLAADSLEGAPADTAHHILLLPFLLSALLVAAALYHLYSSRKNSALKREIADLEALLEATMEGIFIFDSDGVCIQTNSVVCEIFGYEEQEIVGRHASQLICADSLEVVLARMKIPNQAPYEARLRRKDGSCFDALIRGKDIIWNNRPIRVSTVIDISEHKAMQCALEELNRDLERKVSEQVEDIRQKDQMLLHQSKLASMGEMIGAIAHQWRQPLNALNINIQNLDDDYADGLIDEAFIARFIHENGQIIGFMSQTIDQFRNFFRIDDTRENFSVREMIDKTVQIQYAQLRSRNITVEIEGEDILISGYRYAFQQVLLNLISNASDVIAERRIRKGAIHIMLQRNRMTIEDNAGGIDAKILDRVFEPYFTTKSEGEGTGLGLYISNTIMKKHMGGTLEVRNSALGALFEITFAPESIVYLRRRVAPAPGS